MKATLVVFFLFFASSLAVSASANAQLPPGCGPTKIELNVKTQDGQHAAPDPAPGKALIVFLQDDAKYEIVPRPTTRFGIDGAWVGATHANSFFSVSIDPGEHHLCANWQSPGMLIHARRTAVAHFTAEAGKTYYFRARDVALTDSKGAVIAAPEIKFEQVADSDEAQLLMNSFALSMSYPKK
jgi:hypothetical protein